MKQKILLLFTIFILVNIKAQEPRFKSYNIGEPYAAITIDKLNERVWAGRSDGGGVFQLDISSPTPPINFEIYNGGDSSDGVTLSGLVIKTMAADGLGNVWVGHEGFNANVALRGGIERISTITSNETDHYYHDRNTKGLTFFRNHGLVGRRISSIAVDKNNKIWVAQKYHDFYVTIGYFSYYFLTPGDLSFKSPDEEFFTTKGAWWNASNQTYATQPVELPFPANTDVNPLSSQKRDMRSVSTDDTEVWVAVNGYYPRNNSTLAIPSRVLRYDLDGNYIPSGTAQTSTTYSTGGFSFADMHIPSGGRLNGICANNSKGVWVTTNEVGKGFSVYKDDVWHYMSPTDFSQVIPPNTKFNDNAIWKDKAGRVFMGTDKGLIVYNGHGPVYNQGSYTIYTDYEFGATNPRNVYDTTMLSSNITGGSGDPNNSLSNWAATANGIMKISLPIEETAMYNIEDYYVNTKFIDAGYAEDACIVYENDDKLTIVEQLENNSGVTYPDSDVANFPVIAADGSNATLFRVYHFNPEDFYEPISKYKLVVGPGTIYDINNADYIKRYGKFNVRTLSSYPGNINTISDLTNLGYVDIIYTHPEHIESTDYIAGEIFAKYDFYIYDVTTSAPTEVFWHPVKVSVPPVLIGHGVWSDIKSLKGIEDHLKVNGFSEHYLLKAWRTDGAVAENTFIEDAGVIPSYIKSLLKESATHKLSAGKANVIVHSRGGLYTRGYIEEINPAYPYKKDVNSLITLNTPHFGSQGGNFAVDKRVIPYVHTITNAFVEVMTNVSHIPTPTPIAPLQVKVFGQAIASISDAEKIEVNGAYHLLVENDVRSGILPSEDPGFISTLNSNAYLDKLNGTPIHTISTEFTICNLHPELCNNNPTLHSLTTYPKAVETFFVAYMVYKIVVDILPGGVDAFTNHLYGGKNDFIVPLVSMQAGLGNTKYNTHFPSTAEINIPHINLPLSPAVTEKDTVLKVAFDLLKINVHDDTLPRAFKKTGLDRHELDYNFMPFLANASRNTEDISASKILINRDPAIFDNVVEGDVLNYNVYVDNIDELIISYESEGNNFIVNLETRDNLSFENSFSYTIPAEYHGDLKITVYGFKNGVLGYAESIVTLNVGLPTGVTLQGIYFEQENPTILNQDNYNYNIIGTFSDGIERNINNYSGLTVTIENTRIASQVNVTRIKAEAVGSTLLIARINGLEDKILVTVKDNPTLYQTIITGFYGIPNTDNTVIDVNWETLREFENATFVLETSYGTPDNFTEINQQAGNGTLNTSAQFNHADTSFGTNTLIYYRIKMIDTSGNFVYSSTIEINLAATLGVDGEDLSSIKLELYPNPAKTNEVTLKLNTRFTDKNAKLELYSIQGKRLSVQTLNIQEGANSFKLKVGEGLTKGIYLVRVSTTNYIKTVKLIVEK